MKTLANVKNFKASAKLAAINVLRIASAASEGQTVTIGDTVFEVDTGSGVTAGRATINVAAAGTKSTGTLTQLANPANNETAVVGAKTYTFKTVLTGAANEVLIGADCAASIANLIAAINGAAGAGTTYGTGTTANAQAVALVGTPVKATQTLTSDATNVTAADTVTIGNKVYTFVTTTKATQTLTSDATNPTAADTVVIGNKTYTFVETVKATQVLTSDATAPDDGETVTIGNKVYTFKTALTPTEGEVLIGISAATALDNLKAAINHTGTPDTDYKCAAAHTQVTATTNSDTQQTVEAILAGTAANAFATTETSAHLSWAAATLTGGSAPETEGDVNIGVSAAVTLDNLKAAINHTGTPDTDYKCAAAHTQVSATTNADTTQVIEALAAGTAGNSIATTEASTHLSFGAATLAGGSKPETEGDVNIGADAASTLDNLKAAINHTGTPDTDYKCAAAHTQVEATTNADTTQIVQALTAGGAANLFATTETSTHLSWGAATLAGGSDKIGLTAILTGLEGDAIATTETLGSGSFGGAVLSGGADATAEQTTDAIVAAVGSAYPYSATKISANEILFTMAIAGRNVTAVSETLTGSNNAWSAAAFYGGAEEPAELPKARSTSRVPTATEVTLQTMHFAFGFNPASAIVQVRSSAGVLTAFDGSIVITGNRVSVNSAGATDIGANDIVSVIAFD